MNTKEQLTALVDERYKFTMEKVGGLKKKMMGMIVLFVFLALMPVFFQYAGYEIPIGERAWWTTATMLFIAMPIILTLIYVKAFNAIWATFPKEKCMEMKELEQKLKAEEDS